MEGRESGKRRVTARKARASQGSQKHPHHPFYSRGRAPGNAQSYTKLQDCPRLQRSNNSARQPSNGQIKGHSRLHAKRRRLDFKKNPCCSFDIVGTSNARRRMSEGWRFGGKGRHLQARKRKKWQRELQRRRGRARRPWSEGYRAKAGPARREAKRRRVQRRVRRSGSESLFDAAKTLDGEGTQTEIAPLSEICTECPAVIPLSCVECCNITNLPREYSLMLAVRG